MPKTETFNRSVVIKQATNVFHDKGYNATSMQDLVDATGLNRSSIYNSFESKLNLFLECLQHYRSDGESKTSSALLKAKNPLQAIEYIFAFYINEIRADNNNRGCMIVNCKSEMANHNLAITNLLKRHEKNTLSLLTDIVKQGQKDQLINKLKTADQYALYLFSSIQGFRMTGILITNEKKLQGIVDSIMQTLI